MQSNNPAKQKQPVSSFIFLIFMISCTTAAQVFFKFAGLQESRGTTTLLTLILNPWLFTGLCASAVGMLFWVLTLRKIPLAKAYPWTALVYVLTPFLSIFFFKETLTIQYSIGLSLIITGIYISTKSIPTS